MESALPELLPASKKSKLPNGCLVQPFGLFFPNFSVMALYLKFFHPRAVAAILHSSPLVIGSLLADVQVPSLIKAYFDASALVVDSFY